VRVGTIGRFCRQHKQIVLCESPPIVLLERERAGFTSYVNLNRVPSKPGVSQGAAQAPSFVPADQCRSNPAGGKRMKFHVKRAAAGSFARPYANRVPAPTCGGARGSQIYRDPSPGVGATLNCQQSPSTPRRTHVPCFGSSLHRPRNCCERSVGRPRSLGTRCKIGTIPTPFSHVDQADTHIP
jgi:hypothetical protein